MRKSNAGSRFIVISTYEFTSSRPPITGTSSRNKTPAAAAGRQLYCSMPAKAQSDSNTGAAKALPDAALVMIAGRFRALSEPVRLRLLNTLMGGERNVSQLVGSTGTGQANVSRHLAVLRYAGMIAMRRQGLTTVCSISDPSVQQLCEIMCSRLRADTEARARALG